ncbi:TlyA family RNA methyltransferase [Halovulum dunhuangense]|uniref:TlyA family RNA methyltransferase n=1 Tax=Halovulum dunhuangense TaxID=1505036 RepID=A0A849KXI6_9RHOB|nr:TlyA family RNA methyltransferase [Halovulum dunhuangense]NNU79287.1 TlyA family RNA methyltransferase [Halovulum dunhuangense]
MAQRLDQAMVARGLADSRARAQALIAAGAVTVDGAVVTKPAARIAEQAIALAADPLPWVSRAALKLVHALDHFALSPEGAVCADIGASTGGFTEVLLARGAARVIAVDVGHGQLHPRLAADPRIENREGVNARALAPGDLPPLDWVVSDLSFISTTKALAPALAAARSGARLVTLVKPQFELSPGDIGKGGIVRDPALHARAVETVLGWVKARGWQVTGVTDSPIAGGDGNREFLLAARKPG